ncbi:CHAT domain-containing protein [Halomicronema sp. CCY15110]|uniref:CHAT domain-containing protein n=1 Tax=Halomicronema sp. CCY15110 TaxID=2767773 RepID=UPI0019501B40|nr:CHAT domain-containing protein [Halomicronema sp. CCY15110]
MTQEFHLSITALGSDRYLIRTEDTAAGVPVAESQVEWPVEDWLQMAQPALDDPVLGLLQGTADLGDRPSDLQALGQELYRALFQDEAIRESWLRAQGIAQNRNEILRLRLGLKDSRLQRLPWELLRQGQQPITTQGNQTFARYAAHLLVTQTAEMQALSGVDDTIRVLMVLASPHDQDHLQLLQEVRQIQDLLALPAARSTPIQIDILEQPDRSQLAQKLEQGHYQVLHYAGHSDFGQGGGDLSLVNRQTGLTERLAGDDLAGLLVNNQVALTIFNSCRSGHTAGDDAEMDWRQQNLVQALVTRGVPGVIAMAERIPDGVAIAFTQLFYQNLRRGLPIDVSLSRTRQGLIASFGSDQHYWALPILYMHPEFDGYLTRRDREADAQLNPDVLSAPETIPSPLDFEAIPNATSTGTTGQTATVANASVTVLPPESGVNDSAPLPDLPTDAGVAATLLSQLETPNAPDTEEDELLASYVQQLSQNAAARAEPPIAADAEEVLLDDQTQRAGMAIYDTLPDMPPPAAKAVPPTAEQPGSTAATFSVSEAHPSAPSSVTARSPRQPEKPILVWFALGLVGIVGVVGLSLFALRWGGRDVATPAGNDTPSSVVTSEDVAVAPAEPQPANEDPDTLIRRAEAAIRDGRYADAREDFNLALDQALMGNVPHSDVSDPIWTWVKDATQSDLLFIKGRLAWQEAKLITYEQGEFDSRFNQRTYIEQAREAWELTDNTLIEGRIARGFAAYAEADWNSAIANWEAALTLHDAQRERQPNPAGNVPADPAVLHAYAGLIMVHTRLGNMNLAGLAEDPGLSTASDTDQAILNAEAELNRAIAREYFLRLQEMDELSWMDPQKLSIVTAAPEDQLNWIWSLDLLEDWRTAYRYWEQETSSSVLPNPE